MSGVRLGRVGGVTIRAEFSWFVVVALIAASMISRVSVLYDASAPVAVGVGVGASILFFVSLLLHELAHAAVAIRLGIGVEDITLFLFGGATRTRTEHRTAREEFLVTAAGPLTSLALAGVFGLAVWVVGSADAALMGTVGYLAWINLLLALFNLAPAYPLDGGRLLRAAVWAVTGDRERATAVASRVGEFAAWLLIALGVVSFVGGGPGGLWLALIGWFLLQSARGEHLRRRLRAELASVPAEELMRTRPLVLGEDETVDRALRHVGGAGGGGAFPVVDDTGGYVGMITGDELDAVDPPRRGEVRLGELVHQIPDGVTADAHASMTEVFDHLDGPDARVVIVSGPHHTVVGLITPEELVQWARRRDHTPPTDAAS